MDNIEYSETIIVTCGGKCPYKKLSSNGQMINVNSASCKKCIYYVSGHNLGSVIKCNGNRGKIKIEERKRVVYVYNDREYDSLDELRKFIFTIYVEELITNFSNNEDLGDFDDGDVSNLIVENIKILTDKYNEIQNLETTE